MVTRKKHARHSHSAESIASEQRERERERMSRQDRSSQLIRHPTDGRSRRGRSIGSCMQAGSFLTSTASQPAAPKLHWSWRPIIGFQLSSVSCQFATPSRPDSFPLRALLAVANVSDQESRPTQRNRACMHQRPARLIACGYYYVLACYTAQTSYSLATATVCD